MATDQLRQKRGASPSVFASDGGGVSSNSDDRPACGIAKSRTQSANLFSLAGSIYPDAIGSCAADHDNSSAIL